METKRINIIREWYEKYGQSLFRSMCAAARNEDDAREISQETFLKVACKVMKEENSTVIKNPKAFIYRVAYNEFYKRYNQKKHETHLKGILINSSFELANHITPEQEVLSREEYALVQKTIRALPKKQQQVFLLSREENLSHKDIAEKLGIKTVSVKRHIIRALASVREMRKEYRDGD